MQLRVATLNRSARGREVKNSGSQRIRSWKTVWAGAGMRRSLHDCHCRLVPRLVLWVSSCAQTGVQPSECIALVVGEIHSLPGASVQNPLLSCLLLGLLIPLPHVTWPSWNHTDGALMPLTALQPTPTKRASAGWKGLHWKREDNFGLCQLLRLGHKRLAGKLFLHPW